MLQIVIDMSCVPPEVVFVGLVLFNDNYKPKFLHEFYRRFPRLKSYNKKSVRVHEDTLFNILQFFDEKWLRIVCYQFKAHLWKTHERRIIVLF